MENRKLLMRYLIAIAIFTVVYVGLGYMLDYGFNGKLIDYISSHYGLATAEWVLNHKKTLAVIDYVAAVLVISALSVYDAERQINMTVKALAKMNDERNEIPRFPQNMKDIEYHLTETQNRILRNTQAAREAEQRKNDLVVYLAHDLKTPLTSVIGYLSLLAEAPELPTEYRAKYTSIALDKAYRLEQLINEFFDITRFNLQTIELSRGKIHLTLMLQQMVDEFYPVFHEKNICAEVKIEEGLEIVGDADKLERVFDNLIRNAANYCSEGGFVRVNAFKKDSKIRIEIQNTGEEIPKDKLNRIFERFFRLDSARSSKNGGAGLGLAIAKELVELHGGTIAASSNAEYTEFTVVLPAGAEN